MSERDMMAFVLAGSLTVSATVAGLRVTYGLCRPSAAGVTDRIATSHSYIIELVPIQRSDAWRVFKQGEFAITTLLAQPEEFAMIDNAAGNNQHLVQKVDLVIAHDELVRFEKANPAIMGTSTTGDTSRRGAPSQFDWDDIWVELCAVIYLDGLPETQAELVQHIAGWLEGKGKRVPDDSTIKKKIRPLWQRLRSEGKPQVGSMAAT
ncbi:hypothetical protein [Aestuariivirga sp.]|uniref:hypothetical protein n=1 Tax=Aestuariivirga sp. TaxID=2650926 RepID=UPI00359334F2